MDIVNSFLSLVDSGFVHNMATVIFGVTGAIIILTELWFVLEFLGAIGKFMNRVIDKYWPESAETKSVEAIGDKPITAHWWNRITAKR
jgi:hypothetical protein